MVSKTTSTRSLRIRVGFDRDRECRRDSVLEMLTECGQHLVLAVEIAVEGAARDLRRLTDVADRELVRALPAQRFHRAGQDLLYGPLRPWVFGSHSKITSRTT